jgi:uroporphyrin-III C-methyltransferase
VVLSTCQRIEVYFDSDRPTEARDLLIKAVHNSNRISIDDLGKFTYLHSGMSAVHHLFNVAVGLESIVMFENEVQGQVRSAMNRAESWGTLSPSLATTFQRALALGKKVRRSMGETPRRSLAHCAVEFALARTAGATGTRVILLGEGPFAEVVERALAEHGVACDHRTLDAFLSELNDSNADADRELIIFSCLRTTSPVLTKAVFSSWSRTSACRTSIMDLGMPRNVSANVGELLNCQVWDLDDLGAIPPEASLEMIVEARKLVAMEVARYARREARDKSRIGEVILVGAGPGDPNLLTIGGKAAIADATVIVHDRLVSPKILEFGTPDCRLFAAGKEGHGEQAKQDDINQLMASLAREGERVVRLKGGDPFVFGRGAEELQFLASRGIACRVIPGVSSVGAVPASVGIPLTHRLLAHSYSVVSAHDCGDPARPLTRIAELARATDTLVILMGMSRIGEIVRVLRDAGVPAERPAAAIESGTTPHERSVVAPLNRLVQAVADASLKAPGLLVIGEVVGLGAASRPSNPHPSTIDVELAATRAEHLTHVPANLTSVVRASLPARNHAALPRQEGRAARARG